MARGQQDKANQIYGESKDVFKGSQNNANDLYGQLMPLLTNEAKNPQGFDPKDLAGMNTASQQSVGGSTAGAVGEGDLIGARTRNAGSFAPALDESVRSGQRQLSTNALDTQGKNAMLRESNRQAGIAGLGGLYGTNTDAALKALGIGTGAVQAGTEAGKSGWFQNMLGLINGASGAYKAYKGN